MQAERESNKPTLMTSSTEEHSAGELVDGHQPLAGVVKRKRTKRARHQPPASSSTSSSESTTTEEEDMAHCLILLAQGGVAGAVVDSKPSQSQPPAVITPPTAAAQAPVVMVNSKSERYTSRKYTEAATTEDGVKAGFYVYECRTCSKCFPTFQALGGHRASHKKPRLLLLNSTTTTGNEEMMINKPQPPMMTSPPPPAPRAVDVTTALSLNSNHVAAAAGISKMRVHECSICGAEFASGQALGGHMRRHRPLNAPADRAVTTTAITTIIDTKKESIVNLELDLNLPAPLSDEDASSSLPPPPVVLGLGQFNDGNMLTASALVDCHY